MKKSFNNFLKANIIYWYESLDKKIYIKDLKINVKNNEYWWKSSLIILNDKLDNASGNSSRNFISFNKKVVKVVDLELNKVLNQLYDHFYQRYDEILELSEWSENEIEKYLAKEYIDLMSRLYIVILENYYNKLIPFLFTGYYSKREINYGRFMAIFITLVDSIRGVYNEIFEEVNKKIDSILEESIFKKDENEKYHSELEKTNKMSFERAYKILRATSKDSLGSVTKKWKKMAKRFHPDRKGKGNNFYIVEINKAYELIKSLLTAD